MHFASPITVPSGLGSAFVATADDLSAVARQTNAIDGCVRRTFWRNKPNTSSPSLFEDTGQPVTYSSSSMPYIVSDAYGSGARLTFAAISGTNFIYRDFGESSQITRIGATYSFATFGKSTAFGGVTFAFLNDQHAHQSLTTFRLGLHFIITPLGWIAQKASNATGTLVFTDLVTSQGTGTHNFVTPLTDATMLYRTEAIIDVDGILRLYLPDGSVAFVNDPDVVAWSGNYAFHELSAGAADTDCIPGIAETWADTGLQYPPGDQYVTGAQIAGLVGTSFQPIDADLTSIAALDSTTSGAIASDGSGWIKKTYAQFKTALGLVKADVGLGSVDNTSDATKNAATAALTNKDLTGAGNTFPTFNQSTTGNAATATKLATARNIDGQAFDGTAAVTVIAPGTHAATSKTTPVDADELPLADSAASFVLAKLTWANLKAGVKAYYDSVVSVLTNKDLTSGTNTFPTFNQNTTGSAAKWTTARNVDGQALDGTANITVIAPGTHAASSKTTPVDADELPLVDSASSNVLAKLTWANLKAGVKAYYDSVVSVLTNKDLTSGTNTFPTFNQNTTGSAAKWTTARNLAGNSTDGSAAVPFANKFIVQGTADAGLSAAQFTGALGTGVVKNTTTTGVLSIAAAGTDYVAPSGALGTPTSGNLANCTFPTLNQNTTGSAATLTTSRNIDGQAFNGSAAITVIAPGTHAASSKTTPVDADELPLVDSANSNLLAKLTWANVKATLKTYFDSLTTTYTNKRITLRVGTATTSSGTISINTDNFDVFTGTVNAATTLAFTGTPTHGQPLLLELVDAGTSEAITWPGNSGDSGVATRLAATVISKVHRMELVYDNNKTKWMCMAVDAVGY